jgi:nicotinamidase-related amidase
MASGEDPGDHHRLRTAGTERPLIPEIHANAPHAQYVARKGEINAWDNPEFVPR